MPKGPRGEKRPGDVIGAAIKVGRIAVGDEEEDARGDGKDPNAKALGAKGGHARAKTLTKAQQSAIGKKAAKARWKKR